mgnify:CR=1 FL=1
MLKVLPYKIGSESARDLARALGVKRIIPDGGYSPRSSTMVLNWGNSHPRFRHGNYLNKPEAVAVAANKLSTLIKLKANGISVPDFTTDRQVANRWLEDDFRVVARRILTGSSGEGIVIVRPGGTLPAAPLYTKYTKKDQEFRVHVFKDRIIDVCEKRKRNGEEPSDSLIRTHNNGWVFCRDDVYCPQDVRQLAIRAVSVLGLDFGALDVICRNGSAWVLEVNTAPGIQGSTLDCYVEAIRPYVGETRRRHVSRW